MKLNVDLDYYSAQIHILILFMSMNFNFNIKNILYDYLTNVHIFVSLIHPTKLNVIFFYM